MRNSSLLIVLGLAVCLTSTGCNSSAQSRDVSKTEVQQSDAKRRAYVDTLNIPEAQKEQMKAHMGGPPAPPMDSRASGAPSTQRPATGK